MKWIGDLLQEYSDYLVIILTSLPTIILLFGESHEDRGNRKTLTRKGKFALALLIVLVIISIGITYSSKRNKQLEETYLKENFLGLNEQYKNLEEQNEILKESNRRRADINDSLSRSIYNVTDAFKGVYFKELEIQKPIQESQYRKLAISAYLNLEGLKDQFSKINTVYKDADVETMSDLTSLNVESLEGAYLLPLNSLERKKLDILLDLIVDFESITLAFPLKKSLIRLDISFERAVAEKSLDSNEFSVDVEYERRLNKALKEVTDKHFELRCKLKEFEKVLARFSDVVDSWVKFDDKHEVN